MGGGSVRRWPDDWQDCLTLLAGTFHWPPGELLELPREDLLFWVERAKDWGEWRKQSNSL